MKTVFSWTCGFLAYIYDYVSPPYLYYGYPYTGKTTSLYWNAPQCLYLQHPTTSTAWLYCKTWTFFNWSNMAFKIVCSRKQTYYLPKMQWLRRISPDCSHYVFIMLCVTGTPSQWSHMGVQTYQISENSNVRSPDVPANNTDIIRITDHLGILCVENERRIPSQTASNVKTILSCRGTRYLLALLRTPYGLSRDSSPAPSGPSPSAVTPPGGKPGASFRWTMKSLKKLYNCKNKKKGIYSVSIHHFDILVPGARIWGLGK